MVEEDVKVQEQTMVEKAYQAAERLEKANREQAELLKRMEAIESRRILGGQSVAGTPPIPPKEETPAEYAKRMLRGGQ
jgi:hypothetical protein